MGYFLSLSKSATTNWLAASQWALLVFGIVLAVGIIGEIKAWLWGNWKKRFEYIVLIGIMGELLADGGIFLFSSHLQTISDNEVADLNIEAGNARRDAGKAIERASKAEERTAANGKEAARLRKVAEDEKLARVKIERALAPRMLMTPDSDDIAGRLRPFAQNFTSRKVAVTSYSFDAEAIFLSLQLLYILNGAGIEVDDSGIGRSMPVGMIDLGIILTGPPADAPFIEEFVAGLREHLPHLKKFWQVPDMQPTEARGAIDPKALTVKILIASKPVPGIPDVKRYFEKHPPGK